MVGVIFVSVSLHVDEVDDAADVFFEADGEMNRDGVFREALVDRVERLIEVATDLVDFVDEADARDAVFSSLAPDGFGLRFDAHFTIEDDDGAVEDAEGAFDLRGEVDVAWGVDDVDFMAFPVSSDSGGSNGDAAFLFLFHPVGGGATSVAFNEVDFVF